jgi:hypothetical protein
MPVDELGMEEGGLETRDDAATLRGAITTSMTSEGFEWTRERVVTGVAEPAAGGGGASVVLESGRRRNDLLIVLKIVGDLARVEDDGSVFVGLAGDVLDLETTGLM